jgi:hypothetical protein
MVPADGACRGEHCRHAFLRKYRIAQGISKRREYPKLGHAAEEVKSSRGAGSLHRAAWVLFDQAWLPSPLYVAQKLDAADGPFG